MSGSTEKVVSFAAFAGKKQSEHTHIERWVRPELFGKGYLPVPTLLLRYYSQLKPPLNSGQVMFVLQVMAHKWDSKLPFPGYKTIAKRMGVSEKMARTHGKDLRTMKYLRVVPRLAQTNLFDFRPLFDALAVVIQADAEKKGVKGSSETNDLSGPAGEVD